MKALVLTALDQNKEELYEQLESFTKQLTPTVTLCDELDEGDISLVFVATGGTEEQFKRLYDSLSGKVYLLTHPAYNSLAASLEILAFLQEQGREGEILHGSPERLSRKLYQIEKIQKTKEELKGLRLGVLGISDWLIASDVEEERVKERVGIEFIHVPVEELLQEMEVGGYEENPWTQELLDKNFPSAEMKKALEIYGALKRLMKKHSLDGLTLRCFDLLEPLQSTACLALAMLNAEGYPAGCEGDQKSLLSMTLAQKLLGTTAFMANPSWLDPETDEVILAHCTLPLDWPQHYELDTHFESGIGVALRATLSPGPITLFKMDSFRNYVCIEGEILESLDRDDLCRSQMRVFLPWGPEYFLHRPIANHHIFLRGHHKDFLEAFLLEIAPEMDER